MRVNESLPREQSDPNRKRHVAPLSKVIEPLIGGEKRFLDDIGGRESSPGSRIEPHVDPALQPRLVRRKQRGERSAVSVADLRLKSGGIRLRFHEGPRRTKGSTITMCHCADGRRKWEDALGCGRGSEHSAGLRPASTDLPGSPSRRVTMLRERLPGDMLARGCPRRQKPRTSMSNSVSRSTQRSRVAIVLTSMLLASVVANAADTPTANDPKTAANAASARHEYVVDEKTLGVTSVSESAGDNDTAQGLSRCILLVPNKALSGNPWTWRDLSRGHQPPAESELLARGFHVAYITPGPLRQREAWQAFLTEKHRLFRKPLFIGMNTSGELRAGTAKVSITPDDIKIPVHDKVYARSLVLDLNGERLALVAVDLGTYSNEHLVSVCKEKFGISQMVLSSSHTHSAPGRNYAAFFEERLIQVVGDAVKNMFPAKISAGHKSFPQLGFNRLVVREDGHARESWFSDDHYTSENPERIPFGPVDPEVGVIKIEDMQGQPRAIVMNYACHADVVCQNYEISADFPGAATRKVEEAFGNNLNCLFVQGAGGNIESLIISSRRTGPDDPFHTDYSTIERVGGLLAYETVKLAKTLSPPARKETTIRYMNDSLKFTGRFDKNAAFDVHFSTILINDDIVIATFPGEPFIQLQLDWKKKAGIAHPFLFGYTWHQGTWPSYVPDIKSAAQGGYGADQSNRMIEVGSGEAVINKHLENMYRLTGLMRDEPGPVGFKAGVRWRITSVPRDK